MEFEETGLQNENFQRIGYKECEERDLSRRSDLGAGAVLQVLH